MRLSRKVMAVVLAPVWIVLWVVFGAVLVICDAFRVKRGSDLERTETRLA